MAGESESGRNRNERQEHDQKTRAYEETTGIRTPVEGRSGVVGAVAAIMVIALTGLFVSGAIHW